MSASSVTGVGVGESGKLTTRELAILANGPSILIAGSVEVEGAGISSPPTISGEVRFSQAFDDGADNYVVMLTPVNGSNAYIVNMIEEGGKFVGFALNVDNDCEVMYLVTRKGIRARF